MDYLKTNLKWEDFFIQESVELEEKMPTFDMDALSKSKLRLAIENKILDWKKYEQWVLDNLGCSSLKPSVNDSILKNFTINSKQAFDIYSNYDFWSEDLLPIFIWENQLIVFGLQYNEKLVTIDNHIFILASPEALTYFANILFNDKATDNELNEMEKSLSRTLSRIEGIDSFEIKPPSLDFKSATFDPSNSGTATNAKVIPIQQQPKDEVTIWEFITERHEEYSFEAKKHFSAYVVLKVDYNKTKVFKMDADLEKLNVNEKVFEYSLTEPNPFQNVYQTGVSESFSVSQLGLDLMNFKYACITALKRSDKVVGFLVGFKDNNLSENDQVLLEDLAKESA
ncbi:hypothetical protein K2P97_03160 [bacterium]|nr:hypothetical protein [bacterium]